MRRIDKVEPAEEKVKNTKVVNTAFYLMFPAFILAGMAALFAPLYGSILAIALAIYQFLLLKRFIEDYYR
jgi:hypothetical protein